MRDIEYQKKVLRKLMKESLARIDAREEKDAAIFDGVVSLAEVESAKSVFIYNSFDKEPDTARLISRFLADGKRVFLPKIGEDLIMRAVEIGGDTCFEPNIYGIKEPLGLEISAEDLRAEIIILPLLAFDRGLMRLGRGKGYYDRLLKTTAAFKIALAYSAQEVEIVPFDANDEKVDVAVTEKGVVSGVTRERHENNSR